LFHPGDRKGGAEERRQDRPVGRQPPQGRQARLSPHELARAPDHAPDQQEIVHCVIRLLFVYVKTKFNLQSTTIRTLNCHKIFQKQLKNNSPCLKFKIRKSIQNYKHLHVI
jgi:hypothetical protein